MGYIGQAPGLGIKRDFLFYATAGQTSFSGVDVNGMTLIYDPRTVIVYVNGVRVLKGVDYNVPNVSTIVFVTGLEALDEVAVDNFEAFSPANTYDKNEADTLLAKKLSVDLPDSFTELEKGQGRANLGADVLGGFRNKIINGDFDIWQRGTSQTISGFASDDRWANGHNGSTKTHSRQTFVLGQTNVPGEPEFFSRTVVTSSVGAANYCNKAQRIEGVRTLAGKKVTVTFYAKADATKNIAVELSQLFGTGGSPSALVSGIGAQKITLGTDWQKFSFTVDVPSIAGKTIGSDRNDALALNIWFDAGSNFDARTDSLGHQSGTFDIARVSFVEGDATAEADPFSPRPRQQELALCQRYYEITDVFAYDAGRSAGALVSISGIFKVEKRALPTTITNVTYINPGGSIRTGQIENKSTRGWSGYGVCAADGQFEVAGAVIADAEF